MNLAWTFARRILPLEGAKIVTVGIMAGTSILTGQRRDNGLWTNPGGHLDEGETLVQGAIREVFEETGIQLTEQELELVSAERCRSENGYPFSVFSFIAKIEKTRASTKNDPDKEISKWKWVELSNQSEELTPKLRHAKHDHVLCHLGLCRSHGRLSKESVLRGTLTEKRERLSFYSDDWTEDNTPLLSEITNTEGEAIENLKPRPKKP